MKKNEKKGIIISIIIAIMGLVGIIYTTIIKNSIEDIDTMYNMYNIGTGYLVIGIVLISYFIKLSKNKKESQEQENIYEDERINGNRNKACALAFKFVIGASCIADFMVTFFFRQYQELESVLNVFVGLIIAIYLISYYFVSKQN